MSTSHLDTFIDNSINLEGIYSQCNEHLREQDRKRDQLIAFYGAILGLILSNLKNLKEIPYIPWIYLLFTFSSWLLARVIINYLKWHTLYNYSAITLQNLMFFKQEKISQHTVNALFYKTCHHDNYPFKKFIAKTEAQILNLFLMVSCINHYIFLYLLFESYPPANVTVSRIGFLLTTLISCLYIARHNYRAYHILRDIFCKYSQEKKSPDANPPSWCINLYQFEDFIKSQVFSSEVE